MIKAGEYRYFSPVFLHDDDGLVLGIVGGGLTNTPAIKGMRQLAAKRGSKGEDPMSEKTDWAKVAASAGLPNPGAIETADHFNAAIKAKEDAAVAAAEQAANARAEAAESEARKVKATQLIETGLASGALPAGTGDFWTEQAKTAAGMATLEGALAAAAAAKPQAAAAPVPESAKPTPPEPGVVSKQAPGLPTVASEPSVIMASEHLPAGINQLDGELARAEAAIVAARQLKGKPGFRQAALAAYQRQQGV
jgi:phage I-like protein